MKILVTGGSGFIGKTFIKRYRNVFDIIAPTPEQTDLTDARSVAALFKADKFDAVLHLAGLAGGRPAPEADNIIMFKNVQYFAIANGVKKLIAFCDGLECGASSPITDASEDMLDNSLPVGGCGTDGYLIKTLAGKDKITTLLRVFGVYGAGDASRPINKIVAAGARGKRRIVIERDRAVSAISVSDAVRVVAEFLLGDFPRGDYNLVSDDKTSYLEVAKTVRRLVRRDGGDIDIVVKNPKPECECTASNEKLVNTLGVRLASVPSGIKKLYEELSR